MNWYCCICYSDDCRVYDVPVQVLSCFWASSVSFWAKRRAIFSKQSEMVKQVSGCAEWLTVPKGWIQDCCAFVIWFNFSCGSSSMPRSFVRIADAAIIYILLVSYFVKFLTKECFRILLIEIGELKTKNI